MKKWLHSYIRDYVCICMARLSVTLSDSVDKALKLYTADKKGNLKKQSEVIEEAIREFLEKRDFQI